MATTRGQRIGIWTAVIVMTVGTIGGFIAMMLQPGNDAKDQAELQKYTDATQKFQTDREKQTDDLSKKYMSLYKQYSNVVGKFDKDSVKEISKKDLKVGDGNEINEQTSFAAYYIGWNPQGKVFDQSLQKGKLSEPLFYGDEQSGASGLVDGLENASLIDGWRKGIVGMKIGGVREITIPAEDAYGEEGGGNDDIPANTPLKFVIYAIPPLELKEPEMPESVQKMYQSQATGGAY